MNNHRIKRFKQPRSTLPRFSRGSPGAATAAAFFAAAMTGSAAGETLDLAGAYRLAEQNDPAFQEAKATRDAALEFISIARAELRPSVTAGGSGGFEHRNADEPAPARSDAFSVFSLSLDVTQPLYRQELTIRLGQARAQEERAAIDYAASGQDLIVRVAEGYFGILDAIDGYRFAQTNRGAIAQQLRQAQQRFEVGLIAITDVEEAKARFDLASARELQAKNALDNAREVLRETTGEYPDALAPLGEEVLLAMPDPADIDEWTRIADERNLRVRSSSFAAAIAQDEVRAAAAGRSPALDLVGQASASERGGDKFKTESTSGSVLLRLRWPIYTGGSVPAKTAQARARQREAVHRQEQARRAAVRQTRQAYLGVESAIARVGALKQAVVSSQSALDAVEAGFQVGTRTSVDVLDAQRDLFQARNDLASAHYDYIRNALRLRQAAGTLGPADLEAVNEWLN